MPVKTDNDNVYIFKGSFILIIGSNKCKITNDKTPIIATKLIDLKNFLVLAAK